MTIIRGINHETGEVYEISSKSHPDLTYVRNTTHALCIASRIFDQLFEGTDHSIDTLEVIAL